MTVKHIIDNSTFTDVILEVDDYPFYVHSDELEFDKYLNDEVKETRTCTDSSEGTVLLYLKL